MEAALRVLKDHPFSDEAVFASLALIAKHAKQEEFVSKRAELFHAIGGSSFFRRLLTTKKMEAIALNVLTCFCEDTQCAGIIKLECATELLSACESALSSKDEEALQDAVHCLRALEDLSGTARFLLDVIRSDSNIKQASLETFALTKDAFFLDSDAQFCLTLLESQPLQFGFHLCYGLASRWTGSSSPMSGNTLSQTCSIIEYFLRDKKLDTQLRAVVLRLSSVVLDINKEFMLSNRENLLVLLVVTCSIELRVSLARAVNDPQFFVHEQDQNLNPSNVMVTCDACTILDRIASWFAIHNNEIESDKLIANVLSNLTSACEAASLYFSTSSDAHNQQLDTLLTCMVCSIMQIFWMDDPISLRGIKEVFTRGKIKDAIGTMIWRTHASTLRFLVPLLAQLPSELWTRKILENDARNLNRIIENELINGALLDESSPARLVYVVLVVVLTLIEFPDVLLINAIVADNLRTAFKKASTVKMKTENEIDRLCVQGSFLLLESFVNVQNSSELSSRARQFGVSADTLLKNHLSVDGLHDIGEAEYTLLGVGLNWKDLAKVSELVRLECIVGSAREE